MENLEKGSALSTCVTHTALTKNGDQPQIEAFQVRRYSGGLDASLSLLSQQLFYSIGSYHHTRAIIHGTTKLVPLFA
jgi:hypothetical protein